MYTIAIRRLFIGLMLHSCVYISDAAVRCLANLRHTHTQHSLMNAPSYVSMKVQVRKLVQAGRVATNVLMYDEL